MRFDRNRALTLLIVPAFAIAACSGNSPDSDAGSAEQWVTTTPAAKGTLNSITWALPNGEPDSLHWLRSASASNNTVLTTMCEGLIQQAPDSSYQPWLAKSWDTPDDTTYVYHLQTGVTFSDGSPLTADDVVYSLKANQDPKVGSYWSLYFDKVASIEATDQNTVTVKLKEPDALFNQMMATVASTVVKKDYAETKGDAYGTPAGGVMCTGPYSLKSWTPGQNIVVEKNPTYWDKDHQPKVGQVTFDFVTNANTLVQALQSGSIDGAFDIPISAAEALTSSTVGKLYLGQSTKFIDLGFTARPGPAQNTKIREALAYSLDKNAASAKLLGNSVQAIRSPFFPSARSYGQAVYDKAYDQLSDGAPDVAKATKLVGEVDGATAPMKLLTNADDPAAQQLAAYIQAQAKAIGLVVELASMPAAQFSTSSFDIAQRNNFDMVLNTGSYLDIPEPLYWAFGVLAKGQPYNFTDYDNADVNAAVAKAMVTLDPDERAAQMATVSEHAYGNDFVDIAIANDANRLFMNNRITGAPATFTSHLYGPWILDVGSPQ